MTRKPSKVATAKNFHRSVYVIVTKGLTHARGVSEGSSTEQIKWTVNLQ